MPRAYLMHVHPKDYYHSKDYYSLDYTIQVALVDKILASYMNSYYGCIFRCKTVSITSIMNLAIKFMKLLKYFNDSHKKHINLSMQQLRPWSQSTRFWWRHVTSDGLSHRPVTLIFLSIKVTPYVYIHIDGLWDAIMLCMKAYLQWRQNN